MEETYFLETTLPFWKDLTVEEKQFLLENYELKTITKNSILTGYDKACTGLLLVKSGGLRVYLLSEEGRVVTLYRLLPGEICSLSASCLMEEITFDIFIEAQKDSQIIFLNTTVINHLTKKNMAVENALYKMTAKRFSDVMFTMQQILFVRFDKRLATFLLEEYQRQGKSLLALTHEECAKTLGTAREVVSRMLKYFEQEGILKLSRGIIEIKEMEKLKILAK